MNWGPTVQSSHIYILLSKPSKWQKCAQKMGNKMNYLLFIFSLNNYEPTIFKGFNFSLKGEGVKVIPENWYEGRLSALRT